MNSDEGPNLGAIMTSFGSSDKRFKSFSDLKGRVEPTSLNSNNSHEFVNSESLINKQLMSRSRYHLTAHAQDETIPLRTGIIPKTNKVFLDEISMDEDGTAQQTKSN